MKRSVLILLLVTVFMASSILLACSSAPAAQPVAQSDVKTLTVGCTLPFDNSLGMDTKKALDMIIPAFNDAGGLTVQGQKYVIKPVIYDDKYTADGGRAAVERLVNEDKVKFIICQVGSAPIIAGLQVTEPAKVMVMCGGASPKIIDPANKYTFGTATWRTNLPPLFQVFKKAYPNAKTMVNLAPDDETGKSLAASNTAVATAMGIKVLDSIYYPRSTQDFAPFATKIVALNPDIMDYPGAPAGTQFGLQFKALYEAGYKGAHISPMVPNLSEVLSVTPKESMEGLISFLPATDIPQPSDISKQYKTAWMAKNNGVWSSASLDWIPAFYAFVEAVKEADSVDPEVVTAYISTHGLQWDCPSGKAMLVKRPDLKNSRFCDTCEQMYLAQFTNGSNQLLGAVSPEDVMTANQGFYGGTWK